MTAPQSTAAACPPWCDIEDHHQWDGGETLHHTDLSVRLAAFPYDVNCQGHHELAIVSLNQQPGQDPVVLVAVPARTGTDAAMTLAEAEEFRDNLARLITAARA